jgi:signal transduction histidine kinase
MQKRIIIATLFSVLVMLLSLGVVSHISVRDSIRHSLNQSLEQASMIANYTDHLLQINLARLYDVSLSGVVDFDDQNWQPERQALETAYQYSIFTDGLFLLDTHAKVVLTYPRAQISDRDFIGIPDVTRALDEERPFLTGIYTLKETQRKAIFAFAPLKDKVGRIVGVIGGEIDPTTYTLNHVLQSIPATNDVAIDLVDDKGLIIASNQPQRVFDCTDPNRTLGKLIASKTKSVFACHRCHVDGTVTDKGATRTNDMLAFAALQEAPWGVAVREPQALVFAPSSHLKQRFFLLGLVAIVSAVVLAIGISKSVVNPIRQLTRAAQRIASGALDEPVDTVSTDEIGLLSQSFERMRVKLAASLRNIRRHNLKLEKRVVERTRELQHNREQLAKLLDKVMIAQEDERKRIARELHDETIQATAALGLSLEIAAMALHDHKLASGDLLRLKGNVDQLIDGLNGMIQNLRPTILDDLGLESAIKWLLEKHLAAKHIKYHLKSSEEFSTIIAGMRGDSRHEKYELALFRIIQEAIINIAKHARASKVSVTLLCRDATIEIMIQDDGIGFDVQQVFKDADTGDPAGYGILGLRERISLLGGELEIDSRPGEGTSLTVNIPLSSLETSDASDQGDDRR